MATRCKGTWVCRQCTFHNSVDAKRCDMCDARASRETSLKESNVGRIGTGKHAVKRKLPGALLQLQSHMKPAPRMEPAPGAARKSPMNRSDDEYYADEAGEALHDEDEDGQHGDSIESDERNKDLESQEDHNKIEEVDRQAYKSQRVRGGCEGIRNVLGSAAFAVLIGGLRGGGSQDGTSSDESDELRSHSEVENEEDRELSGGEDANFSTASGDEPALHLNELNDFIEDAVDEEAEEDYNEDENEEENEDNGDNQKSSAPFKEPATLADAEAVIAAGKNGHESLKRERLERGSLSSQDRTKRRAAGGPWDCAMCSFQNPWLRMTCSICFSPRPSTHDSSETAMGTQVRPPPLLLKAQLKQEVRLRKQLEKKRRAALKTLARVAASSLSSEKPSLVLSEKRRRELEKKPEVVATKRHRLEQRQERNISSDVNRHRMRPPPAPPPRKESSEFEVGTLLKYAFEDLVQTWVWYLGVVLERFSSSNNRSPWFKVLFEDGENLWVYLDAPSKDRLWAGIKPALRAAENVRFEHNLELASPGAVARLHKKLARVAATSDPEIIVAVSNPGRKLGRPPKHAASVGDADMGTNAEVDDEFGIMAADEPPPNWSHPPSVNSLDPTSVETFSSAAPSTPNRKHVPREKPQRQTSARNQDGRKHITKLKSMPKREVSMLTMRNGELFAVLRSDEAVITGIKPRSRHGAAERAVESADAEPGQVIVGSAHWVACDRCLKWRRVSELTFEQSQASDAQWFCEQNVDDPSRAACTAPEETEDDGESVQVPVELSAEDAAPKENTGSASASHPWILSAEEAYCACLKAGSMLNMTPSMDASEVDSALQAVLKFVARALNELPTQDARWAPVLHKIASSQTLATAHRYLRALVFGATRTGDPLPALQAGVTTTAKPARAKSTSAALKPVGAMAPFAMTAVALAATGSGPATDSAATVAAVTVAAAEAASTRSVLLLPKRITALGVGAPAQDLVGSGDRSAAESAAQENPSYPRLEIIGLLGKSRLNGHQGGSSCEGLGPGSGSIPGPGSGAVQLSGPLGQSARGALWASAAADAVGSLIAHAVSGLPGSSLAACAHELEASRVDEKLTEKRKRLCDLLCSQKWPHSAAKEEVSRWNMVAYVRKRGSIEYSYRHQDGATHTAWRDVERRYMSHYTEMPPGAKLNGHGRWRYLPSSSSSAAAAAPRALSSSSSAAAPAAASPEAALGDAVGAAFESSAAEAPAHGDVEVAGGVDVSNVEVVLEIEPDGPPIVHGAPFASSSLPQPPRGAVQLQQHQLQQQQQQQQRQNHPSLHHLQQQQYHTQQQLHQHQQLIAHQQLHEQLHLHQQHLQQFQQRQLHAAIMQPMPPGLPPALLASALSSALSPGSGSGSLLSPHSSNSTATAAGSSPAASVSHAEYLQRAALAGDFQQQLQRMQEQQHQQQRWQLQLSLQQQHHQHQHHKLQHQRQHQHRQQSALQQHLLQPKLSVSLTAAAAATARSPASGADLAPEPAAVQAPNQGTEDSAPAPKHSP